MCSLLSVDLMYSLIVIVYDLFNWGWNLSVLFLYYVKYLMIIREIKMFGKGGMGNLMK